MLCVYLYKQIWWNHFWWVGVCVKNAWHANKDIIPSTISVMRATAYLSKIIQAATQQNNSKLEKTLRLQ